MKIAGLIIGILLMVVAVIAFIVCLLLPSLTNNHVSRGEAMLGIIPSIVVFVLAFLITLVSAIVFLKGRKGPS